MKANKLPALLLILSLTACSRFDISIGPLPTAIPTSTVEIPTITATVFASPTGPIVPTATIAIPSPTLFVPTATLVPPTRTASAPGPATQSE